MKKSLIFFKNTKNYERGNVLFVVLIAVALFGALSYAITQDTGSITTGTNEEKNVLLASNILEYSKQLEQAVTNIRREGYSENEISFDHADLTGYTNGSSSDQTEVFNALGGGLAYRAFPDATGSDWIFTSANSINQFSDSTACSASDTDCSELMAILPNISEDLCNIINDTLSIPGIPADSGNASITAKFTGSFSQVNAIDDAGSDLDDVTTACFEGGGTPASGTYHFYHVLIKR